MEPQHNGFLIIPAFIADDPEIDDATFKLFGRLSALTNQKGYCWASNKYLAEVSRVKEREVQKRLKHLEEKGYIRKEITKVGMNSERKIFIVMSKENSNNSYKRPHGHPRHVHTDTLDTSLGTPKQDKCSNNIKEQQQAAPAAAVFSCIQEEKRISQKEWKHLMKFPEDEVDKAIKYTQQAAKAGIIETSFIQYLKWVLKDKPDLKQVVDAKENKNIAEDYESRSYSANFILEALSKYAIISPKVGQSVPIVVNYDKPMFKEILLEAMKKCKFGNMR